MKKYLFLGVLAALVFSVAPFKPALAYTWTAQTGSTAQDWQALASSSDGTHLAAAVGSYAFSPGYIYTSTDGGVTWTPQIASGSRVWRAITSSSDGLKLAATTTGYIYTSTDGGATWTQRTSAGSRSWSSIASSSDGMKLAATDGTYGGHIYTSIDGGATWTDRPVVSAGYWGTIASSSDGMKLAAAAGGSGMWYNNYIYTSTNGGVTWTQQTGSGLGNAWSSIASSSDGTKLAATDYNGYIHTSIDSGVTWTTRTVAGHRTWNSIASSSDGMKLVAGTSYDYIHLSTDGGVTWAQEPVGATKLWYAVTSSSDGLKLAAAGGNSTGGDYVYTNTSGLLVTPPTVTTDVASSLNTTSAALNNHITSFGGATSVTSGFDYGTTTAYGSSAAIMTIPSSIGIPNSNGEGVFGLICGTTYHYRAWATNSAGTGYGADLTFTTLPCSPLIVTTTAATSITSTSATLNGSVNITPGYGFTGPPIYVGFETSLTGSYGPGLPPTFAIGGWGAFSSYPVTGLSCGTLYHYRAFALDGSTPIFGADMTFTTLPCSVVTPIVLFQTNVPGCDVYVGASITTGASCVGSTFVTSITTTSATIYGRVADMGGASSVTTAFGYGPSYGTVVPSTTVTTTAGTGGSFSTTLTGLSCGTVYSYRPIGTNSTGTYYGSMSVVPGGPTTLPKITTLPCPLPTLTVTTLPATSITATSALFNGSYAQMGLSGLTGTFNFDYGTTTAYGSTSGTLTVTPTGPGSTFGGTVGGLTCGTLYHYRAKGTIASTNATGADMTFTTAPCAGWTHSSAARNWVSSAISSDGSRAVAGVDSGYVSTSSTYGASWTEHTSMGSHFFESAASSADGMKLAVADVASGYVYTSTDGGTTWIPRVSAGVHQWTGVASSADGMKLIAVGGGNIVSTSTNGGATWTIHSPVTGSSAVWSSVASSTDGLHLVIASLTGTTGYIYTSLDGGLTWTQRTGAGMRNWQSVASSAGGMKLAAVARGTAGTTTTYYVYTSIDGGATWTAQIGSGLRYWSKIASSYDGSRLAAIASTDVSGLNGTLYLSSDSGVTWTPVTTSGLNRWSSVALSCDATQMIATTYSSAPSSWLPNGSIWMGHSILTASPCTTETYATTAPRMTPAVDPSLTTTALPSLENTLNPTNTTVTGTQTNTTTLYPYLFDQTTTNVQTTSPSTTTATSTNSTILNAGTTTKSTSTYVSPTVQPAPTTRTISPTKTYSSSRLGGFALGALTDSSAPIATEEAQTGASGSAATPLFKRTLRYGSEGEDVGRLQKMLNDKGYLTVEPTGFYGLATTRAVKALQSAQGLDTVGSVGPKTLSLINSSGN